MPELPEVEVLVCHLEPILLNKKIQRVEVCRKKSIRPTSSRLMRDRLTGAKFKSIKRRAKYLLFEMTPPKKKPAFLMLGHLGMTGRMYVQPKKANLPRHTVLVLELARYNFVFEDTRYFGRMTLDTGALSVLGPEPMSDGFNGQVLREALGRSTQAIKVKLLDQSIVAGIGNIYASEILFHAGISPRKAAGRLTRAECADLVVAIQGTLAKAIECGSTVSLDFSGAGERNGLFYYGQTDEGADYYDEELLVYDREDEPCTRCGRPIRRIIQSARSTYYCPKCQRS